MSDIVVKKSVVSVYGSQPVEQGTIIDPKLNWAFVKHNGEVLSLSVSNLIDLQDTIGEALKKYKSINQ